MYKEFQKLLSNTSDTMSGKHTHCLFTISDRNFLGNGPQTFLGMIWFSDERIGNQPCCNLVLNSEGMESRENMISLAPGDKKMGSEGKAFYHVN